MDKKKPQLFYPEDDSGKIILEWWKNLEENRGDRAELRRADSPTEVVFSPSYHRLYWKLLSLDQPINREYLASVVGLCAHVRTHNAEAGLAEQMARGQDKASVSGLRFRRLLAINNRDDLYHAMIRIIRLLGKSVNIHKLALAVYWWNEHTKKQWAYEYYEHAPAKEK